MSEAALAMMSHRSDASIAPLPIYPGIHLLHFITSARLESLDPLPGTFELGVSCCGGC
jgi:hypothetical protein